MKEIKLTQGKVALVDDDDLERLKQYKWYASWSGHCYRPVRNIWKDGKRAPKEYLYRVIMNAKPGQMIDHINGDPLDNRKCNLRFCTQRQNVYNKSRHKSKGGKYKGTYKDGNGTWVASIMKDGKRYRVFGIKNELLAAKQYDKMAKRLFGEFSCVNFPS